MNGTREQLTDYFKSELAELRHDATQFAKDYPSIAEELALNQGKSRDPHIEILLQSFSWMTSRLRQNMDSESKQIPTMLLQQLYPHLVSSLPSMAIMECDVNGSKADFENGYQFAGKRLFEPYNVPGKKGISEKLSNCRFSSSHSVSLCPFTVTSVGKHPVNRQEYIRNNYRSAQAIIDVKIGPSSGGAPDGVRIKTPLRFFMNLNEHGKFPFYDLLASHFLGAVVLDHEGNQVKVLQKSALKFSGFEDHERLMSGANQQDLGFSLLFDYFAFPEKFLFFELGDMQDVPFNGELRLMLVLDSPIPGSIQLNNDSLKLNCVPVVNLYSKTSEPIPLSYKDYRYKLFPSRENYDCYEIFQVNKVFAMNRRGESRQLLPYFCLTGHDRSGSDYRWQCQIETSHKKQLPGTEAWLSLFSSDYVRDCPVGETVYAETLCCNRTWSELFNIGQEFSTIGSSPVTRATLLTRPTRYRAAKTNYEQLWKVLSHLSLYFVSLSDNELAQDTLTTILELYSNKENSVNQSQIASIESFIAKDDVFAVTDAGWRGYYHGVNFKLTLYERKFDGSSMILFGSVLNQFLALFTQINSFVRLELYVGNKKLYEWKPLCGHKHLA